MYFSNYPILKVLVPYIIGIFVAYWGHNLLPNINILVFLIIILSILLIISILYSFLPYSFHQCVVLPLLIVPFLIGSFFTYQKYTFPYKNANFENVENSDFFTVFVTAPPQEKKKSVKILVDIEKNEHGERMGKSAILYLQKSSEALALTIGDVLLIHAHFTRITPPMNPYSFDNHEYMKRKGIYFTTYVPTTNWLYLQHHTMKPLKCLAHRLQRLFSSLFRKNGLNGEEYAIITAILLGNDETLEPELKAQYAAAGVSHILCVSGMHVGIIFMIINTLLQPLDCFPKLKLLKMMFLIVFIWLYAHITGLAPSVMRAATMFTFVIFGQQLNYRTDVFHSLFASLFFLLIINPLLILEIGFQMSYLAVFGIVLIQPRIANLWKVKNKIGKYFWDLITVSCAAQFATAPLSVYYFGQFPNYFLLSNLAVISLSFVIVISGVVVLIFSWCTWVVSFFGMILSMEIKMMNGIIAFINTLPYSVTDMLSLQFYQVVLIYGMIFFIFLFFIKKNKYLKYCSLSIILLLGVSLLYEKNKTDNFSNIVIYSAEKSTALHLVSGHSAYLLLDSLSKNSPAFYNFNVKNFERMQQIKSQYVDIDTNEFFAPNLLKLRNFIVFQNQKIFVLSGKQKLFPSNNKMKINTLYVRNNARIPFSKLLSSIQFDNVVVDGSNSPFYEKSWCDSCLKYQIPCYSTRKSGYLCLIP